MTQIVFTSNPSPTQYYLQQKITAQQEYTQGATSKMSSWLISWL